MGMAVQARVLVAVVVILTLLASPASAFGAGFVAQGSSVQKTKFRHGDILYGVYFLRQAHSTLVRQIYFGNWLRDFSQLMDRGAMELIPEPILRAVVAIFAYVQFGYTTGEFEVTQERLGYYKPVEHVDNPRGYENNADPRLRPSINLQELAIDSASGMKSYVANQAVTEIHVTSRDFVDRELVAAIASARAGSAEAYTHLGSALHTLEDFLAHSNWTELCLQMLASEVADENMKQVFPFVGGKASIDTKRGRAPPLVTGTFGPLDLFQTVLGELDDKLSSMSLPGLQKRMKGPDEPLSKLSEALIDIFRNLGNKEFTGDISSITKSFNKDPADWGKLSETPELLWQQLHPIFRLRDKIVRWVYDHLTVNSVANAIAAISTALDKLVYRVLGLFLSPVLQDLSALLLTQEKRLLAEDQRQRLIRGEESIFDPKSHATDPTHSQLCKDHYADPLNELAGRVATVVTTFTIKKVIEIWQPGSNVDVRPTLESILASFHHPFNYSKESEVQSLMVAEVLNWCTIKKQQNPEQFADTLRKLSHSHMTAEHEAEYEALAHSQSTATASSNPTAGHIPSRTAHTLTTMDTTGPQPEFIDRITSNIEKGLGGGIFGELGIDDLPGIKQILQASPSAETPNPIDQSLIRIPGLGLLSVFDGIDISEIVAAPGMGVILKDAVINMRLQDSEWVEAEQIAARQQLAVLEDRPIKEMLALLDFGATVKSTERPSEESKTTKLMNKLKIGSSKDG